MYNSKVLEIFKNPKNAGTVKGANGVGKVESASYGDIIKIYIRVSENGIIEDAKFKTFGCPAAISCSSVASELIKGKNIDEAFLISSAKIVEVLGELPTEKVYCPALAEEAIKAAIEDYQKKNSKK